LKRFIAQTTGSSMGQGPFFLLRWLFVVPDGEAQSMIEKGLRKKQWI